MCGILLSFTGTTCDFVGRCDAERVRHNSEPAGQASEALPAADLWYYPVASQQQVSEGAATGCGSHL